MSKAKKNSRKSRGLAALATMKKEAPNPGMFFVGLIGSAFAAKLIDKVLPVTPDAEGKTGVKKFIKPVALLIVGGGVAYFGRGKEYLRYLGYGIATGGIVSATKVILNKDIFGGLGEMFSDELQTMIDNIQSQPAWLAAVKDKAEKNGNSLEEQVRLDAQWMLDQKGTAGIGATRPLRRSVDAEMFREAADTEKRLLRQNSYDPDLSSNFENEFDGVGDANDEMLLGLDKIEDADYEILGLDNPSNEEIL